MMDDSDREDVKRHMSVLVEQVRSEVRPVMEAVLGLGQRMDRLETKIGAEFEETRAMIRLSYAELDRRLSTLEGGYAELRGRVDRLEKVS